jgi:hypothetical protein
MSRKHNQRTRAEILAKREQPLTEWAGWKNFPFTPKSIGFQANADVRRASRSKYTPHFGAKQREKVIRAFERQALKLAA